MKNKLVISIPTILAILLATYLFPWKKINWGTLRIGPERTITVSGQASITEANQIAHFTAGVLTSNDDKGTAVSEVENKMKNIVDAIKAFGIPNSDIKTESVSVYEREDEIYEREKKVDLGKWHASSSISIVLRDIDKASEFTSLLTELETSNVYGPNFTLDDTQETEKKLLEDAIGNAREKAEIVAETQDVKLGDIISVSEGYQQQSLLFAREESIAIDTGMPMEPGSSKVSKTVTVTFGVK
ncbi:SIMPL domain-containing protein [Patescibacteria group bacterium]|nr:SIMPL domain-containing protein [Patescibacteria group bacterium]